jgi:hypothetical protein
MLDDIINLFTKEHGVYKQIFKFNVILVFLALLFVLVKVDFLNRSIFVLIALIFALYLTNVYVKVNQNDLADNNKVIYFKLESLQAKVYEYIQFKISITSVGNKKMSASDMQKLFERNKLDSLYIDANMIVFLYSIIKLYEYNPNEFYLLLKGTNNILKLRNDIEKYYEAEGEYPENIHEMLQIALQLKTNCMNNLQNFIYGVPKTHKMYNYIDSVLQTYNILITKNIKVMHNYHLDYIKTKGINSNTVFIDINASKHFDESTNYSVIPSKSGLKHKLIDLYV